MGELGEPSFIFNDLGVNHQVNQVHMRGERFTIGSLFRFTL